MFPPLIDREIFFGNPKITGAQLSPDGTKMSFLMAHNGVLNIWLKDISTPFDEAIPLTKEEKRPIRSYFWTWDSKYIIYSQDLGGDENFSLFRVDPTKARKELTPDAFELTPFPETHSYVLSLPKAKPDIILVACNDRDKAWHDFYSINIESGQRTLVYQNNERLSGLYFDLQAKPRLASRSTSDGGHEILQLTSQGVTRLFYANLEESIHPIRFTRDDKLYLISNIGPVDLSALYIYDFNKKALELVESDPEDQVDLENVRFSTLTDELLATIYIGDKKRIYWKNKDFEKDYLFLKDRFSGSEVSISSSSKDEKLWIVYVASDKDPGSAYLFDRSSQKIEFLYQPRPELPIEQLASMTAVRFQSLDGLTIPAYLTMPNDGTESLKPGVILVHGGPWARDYWGYHSYAQFLANRGYAVLQINFRGSTGYGKSFLNAAINEWGEKMQDDLTAGYNYLVENNISGPHQVAIMGGSYGGYATLAGLCFTPDIYAAGVSIVGPSNLFTLLDTIPPYWESARVMFHKRMGDPNTEDGKAQLKRQSPFFHADRIKAPLLVAQGANDPRVKKSESDQIVIAMRDKGKSVEYLNFPDEGHGFAKPENNMAFIAVMEKFLSKHLGGRYQDSVRPELQSIIDSVKLDISTLKMPKIISVYERNQALKKPDKIITAHQLNYQIAIEMDGQEMLFDLKRSIDIVDNNLILVDSSDNGQDRMIDKTIVSSNSFSFISRHYAQGLLEMNIDLIENKLQTNTVLNGSKSTVVKEVNHDFIMDSSMLDVYISFLTLEKQSSPQLVRVFNMQKQKIEYYNLLYANDTLVEGNDCRLVEIYDLEDDTLVEKVWIHNSDLPHMIKKEKVIKEMNGAKMVMKLTHFS